ncbi:MAG: hypothetical protein IKE58_02475 [Blautia sp.]|nr:hypothetical protein [Blautia sp.]
MKYRQIRLLALAASISLVTVTAGLYTGQAEEAVDEIAVEEFSPEGLDNALDQEVSKAPASEENQARFQASCNYFTVSVPMDIVAIADIEVEPDGVSFYEKLSHSLYGGFVGKITLFEKETDYCYYPSFGRGGEIVFSDGSKKDVVLLYPSDVQSDLENPESMDNWRKIRDALDSDIVGSLLPSDGTYIPQDEVDNTSIYRETLDKLSSLLQEKADQETLEAAGFSYLYAFLYETEENPLETVRYAYVNVSYAGYPELAIMHEGEDVIYDLFAQEDSQVTHVCSGAARDRFSLYGHGGRSLSIREDASSGADMSEISFYGLDVNTKDLFPQVSFIYDGQKDPENPWFVRYTHEEDPEPLTEEEWQSRLSNFGELYTPEAAPLSDIG